MQCSVAIACLPSSNTLSAVKGGAECDSIMKNFICARGRVYAAGNRNIAFQAQDKSKVEQRNRGLH